MKIFYVKNRSNVFQEIRYINYLTSNLALFEGFINTFNLTKSREDLLLQLSQNYIVLIPRADILKSLQKISVQEKRELKNVKKILKNIKSLEKYFYIVQVLDANLTDLDESLSKLFKSQKQPAIVDDITILNSPVNSRLQQYRDIVFGINSDKVNYTETINFYKAMQKLLLNVGNKHKDLKVLHMQYSLGTSIVS